jgi:hypothetical protein
MTRLTTEPLPGRSWSEAVAMLLAGAGFVALGGLSGVASAIGIGIVWLLLPSVYAVTIGYGLLAAFTIDGGVSLNALIVGIGLFAMLLAPAARLYRWETLVFVIVFAMATLFLVFAIAFATTDTLRSAALALAVTWAVAAYGVHRYERMILGLAGGSS